MPEAANAGDVADENVVIDRIGAQGDGVVDRGGDPPLFVPFALPGETWRLGADGEGAELVRSSPERAAPVCRHFGICGGCVAQHMAPALYARWKVDAIAEAFRHRGVAAEIAPLEPVPLASRRRAHFGIDRDGDDVRIGFRRAGEHTLVKLAECPVLEPAIVGALPALAAMGRIAMPERQSGRLVVTLLDHGLDAAFENGLKSLSPEARERLAHFARRAGLARLVVAGDTIAEPAPATLTVDGIAVAPAPGAFLQAVRSAEERLIGLVLSALPKRAKRVADLFSGIGTFSLPLARRAAVTAFDSDKRAISALTGAVRNAQGLKPVEARVRDLFREPLSPRELDEFDVVVLDPPRAGAAEQAARLARSKVKTVIAVSCAPATLARDAKVLIDGGYAMGVVTPIDQFLFSPHVEAAAVFRR